MMIYELSGRMRKTQCEHCGKTTICFEQGAITPISRQLSHEDWLCGECVEEDDGFMH
jgi:hypothetical protein